ncbi:MAG: hypothetical protein NWQ06_10060 [Leeuwenhoekiella sp.]|uniref:hypothetical protein n=1 Tax=Leeuwenhoekiella sp. MAR_2009_132 TaxID=1392489 RepID=UPI00048FBF7B|nr:hypothetical protein [Leeuwenhoekiella sp. MAR_2009_132]MDP5045307.1 hypothetical protein [Leeuwenhoekiella sp.]
MKYIFFIATVVLMGVYDASAQYGYGGGYGGNGYGRSRMGSSMMGAGATQQGPKEEPKTSAELVDERIDEYVTEFELDPFETEVLRTYLETHFDNVMGLQKDKTKDAETMRKDFERMQTEFKTNLKSILSEEEIEKFITMDFTSSAVRKRKKNREN